MGSTNLFKVLSDLRNTNLSYPAFVGLPLLDDIFRASKQVASSARSHEAATAEARAGVPHSNLATEKSYKYVPPIIEVKAAESTAGQWAFLYHAAAEILLGKSENDGTYNPQSSQRPGALILWLDCFHRLSIRRLYKTMLSLLPPPQQHLSPNHIDPRISPALENLHIFRPESSAQLLSTVRSLETHILSLQDRDKAGSLTIGAIIMSDLSSFYWEDRQREEGEKAASRLDASAARVAPGSGGGDQEAATAGERPPLQADAVDARPKRAVPFTVLSHHSSLTALLSKLARTFLCPVLVSSTSFFPVVSGQARGQLALRSVLPSPWVRVVNVEVVLQKERKGEDGRDAERMEIRGWVDARRWIRGCFEKGMGESSLERAGTVGFKMDIAGKKIEVVRDDEQLLG